MVIGKSIIDVFERFNFPKLIDGNGRLINKKFILMNKFFIKWKRLSALVENKKLWLFVGYDIPFQKMKKSAAPLIICT